jgi:hypothetical protein
LAQLVASQATNSTDPISLIDVVFDTELDFPHLFKGYWRGQPVKIRMARADASADVCDRAFVAFVCVYVSSSFTVALRGTNDVMSRAASARCAVRWHRAVTQVL